MATTVIVQSLSDYAHAQLVTTKGHGRGFVVDEPSEDGGNDLGPTPYELLAAALGACTAMTIQHYARRKEYPLLELAVEVEHDKRHAQDSEESDGAAGGFVETLRRKIVLRGPLSEAQRDDLLRVAAKCPVHKTLLHDPTIIDTIEVVA